MNWFLMVLITSTVGGLHEGFLWYDPKFDSKQECIEWANNNPVTIINTLNYEFSDWQIKQMVCVREDKFEELQLQPYMGPEV